MCYCLFCLCKYTYLARSIHARRTKPIFDTTTTNNNWEEITRVPMRFIVAVPPSTSLFFLFQTIFYVYFVHHHIGFFVRKFSFWYILWHYLFWNLRLECLLNVWYLVATVITCWRNKTEIINHSAMNQSDHQQTTLYLWFFFWFIFP